MTIIVAMQGVMAADSGQSQGGIMRRVFRPKIVRNDKRWLAAWAGSAADGEIFEKWFLAGAPEDVPKLDGESFSALMMAPDGVVWRVDKPLVPYRMAEPVICGEETAESFVLGAIMAGASPEKAIELACQCCSWAAGPVQVEHAAAINVDPGGIIEVDGEAFRLGRIVPVSRHA